MRVIAESEGRIFVALDVERPAELVSAFPGRLFPCLVWDHGTRLSDEDRWAMAVALLDSGCRYAVCGGARCEDWHDAVDAAFVAKHIDDPDEVLDEIHVMTTWHDGESADEV